MYKQRLLRQLSRYLSDEISLTELENWLIANLSTVLSSGDKDAEELSNQLDANLVWLRQGLLTDPEFRSWVAKLFTRWSTTASNSTAFEMTQQWLA